MTKKNLTVSSICDESILLPRKALDLIKALSENELKTLLYASAFKRFSVSEAATELGLTVEETEKAVEELEKKSLLKLSNEEDKQTKTPKLTQYDGEELAEAIEKQDDFKALTVFASETLGKLLNRNDLNSLYNLYDYHAVQAELLCGIIEYCASKGKTGMAYVHSTTLSMLADGIDSYEKLDGYLRLKKSAESKSNKFKKLCGFGSRELSAKEKQYLQRWFEEMTLSLELVKYAYELMVNSIGEVRLAYMAKILEQWYAKGLRTPAEVEAYKTSESKSGGAKGDKSYDADEFFAAAASRGYLKKGAKGAKEDKNGEDNE